MASQLDADRLSSLILMARTKCDALSPDELSKLDEDMAIDFEEHFSFQNLQASAHALGRLTTEAAQVVYRALGEIHNDSNGGWATGTDTATKVIITQLMGELLRLQLAQKLAV